MIAIVVVAVIAIGALAASGVFSAKPESSPTKVTVATAGTDWPLNAGDHETVGPIDLLNSSSWTVSGAFTATSGVTAYVMTWEDYDGWDPVGPPTSYFWISGSNVTSGSVNTVLFSDTYYFVWYDPWFTHASTTVDITSNVVATASG